MKLNRVLIVFAGTLLAVLVLAGGYRILSSRGRATEIEKLLTEQDLGLLSFREAVVGTVGGNRSNEYVLFTTGDPSMLRMDVYQEDEDSMECISYIVPAETAKACFRYIDKNNLRRWEGMRNAVSIDGLMISCAFWDGDEYTYVSTDEMPEDGDKVLLGIQHILTQYVLEENRIRE